MTRRVNTLAGCLGDYKPLRVRLSACPATPLAVMSVARSRRLRGTWGCAAKVEHDQHSGRDRKRDLVDAPSRKVQNSDDMERLFALCPIIDTSRHAEYPQRECKRTLLVFEERAAESLVLAE